MHLMKLLLLISFAVAAEANILFQIPFLAHLSRSPMCWPPKKELYGAKTLYMEADKCLSNSNCRPPRTFGAKSLEQEHKGLIKEGCRPILFYLFNRHAARFPSGAAITKYNENLGKLVAEIRSTNKACLNMRSQFNEWEPRMNPKQGKHVTHFGGLELREVAQQYKRLYPNFFDTKTADIRLGVTSKLRSIQSGNYFIREIEGLDLGSCKYASSGDISDNENSDQEVIDAECYKYLSDKFYMPCLEFHELCIGIGGKAKEKHQFFERVNCPKAKQPIIDRVSHKLGVNITSKILGNIWKVCRYESAFQGNSIWCSVFEQKDIEALNYIEDVNLYFGGLYGSKANPKMSCLLVSHLFEQLNSAIEKAKTGNLTPQVYFFLSHDTAMRKLFAAFGLFKDEKNYSEDAILQFETKLKVPEKREWRSALSLPFSGSLAFTLYHCPSSLEKFQLLTSVTGRPVKLGGCNGVRCGIKTFFDSYSQLLECDFKSICSKPSVV